MRRQSFKWVSIGIHSFMDGAGEVLENAPDPISEVKVERIKIMHVGDGMDVVLF
jgi:hypothetical protein